MADEPIDEPEVAFAFSPALAVQGLLDYTKSKHFKIYKSAIREVSKEPFDCVAEGLYQFLKDVQDRADKMGWSEGILNITLEVTDNGNPVEENLIDNYGTISLEQVVESELQYINEEGRGAQDTYMLYKCLMASLTNATKKRISLWSDQYRIGNNDLCSGVALLKIIIRESHLDTNATTNQIRTKLSNLDSYILTVDSDIGKFNQYVKLLVQSLTARNQRTSDLLINLFKGYGAVSDEVFRAWLMRKQDDHEEGEELTPDDLMIAAKNKYDTMVEKGTWNAPTAEEKIVALEAKFNSTMKSLNKKVSFEKSKKKGTKSGGEKQTSKKKEGDHPKKWKAPARRSGRHPNKVTRKRSSLKVIPGTGAEKTPVESARSGEPTSQKNARVWQPQTQPATSKSETRRLDQNRRRRSIRSSRLLRPTSPRWNNRPTRIQLRTKTANDGEGGLTQ